MQAQIDALESAQPSDGKQAQAGQVMLSLYILLALSQLIGNETSQQSQPLRKLQGSNPLVFLQSAHHPANSNS